jgi:hypothetical protein
VLRFREILLAAQSQKIDTFVASATNPGENKLDARRLCQEAVLGVFTRVRIFWSEGAFVAQPATKLVT